LFASAAIVIVRFTENFLFEVVMKIRARCITIGAFVLLIACSGEMQGVVRGEGTPVQFQYEQGMESDAYTAQVGEEQFSGKAVQADSRSGFGTVFGTGMPSTIMTSSSSGNFVATLIGNRGSSLRCQMNYASSLGETSAGGVGVCNHSDGRVIDVVW
jgi:hypothetical protein